MRILITFILCLLAAPVLAHGPTGETKKYVSRAITVSGAVKNTLTLSVTDLKKLPVVTVNDIPITNHHGVTVRRLKNVKGVKLKDILNKAVLIAPDHNDLKKTVVVATASDDYKVVFSYQEIANSPLGDSIIVFYEVDGKPLGADSGLIGLVSAKDIRTGPRHVKWLKDISVIKVAK
ncbi:MAG: molybdopterin-dependent oxidoreductase [Asticcacaulis sp.]